MLSWGGGGGWSCAEWSLLQFITSQAKSLSGQTGEWYGGVERNVPLALPPSPPTHLPTVGTPIEIWSFLQAFRYCYTLEVTEKKVFRYMLWVAENCHLLKGIDEIQLFLLTARNPMWLQWMSIQTFVFALRHNCGFYCRSEIPCNRAVRIIMFSRFVLLILYDVIQWAPKD